MSLVSHKHRRGHRAGSGDGFYVERNFVQAFGKREQRVNAGNVGVIEDHLPSELLADKQAHKSTAQYLVALNNRLRTFLRVAIVDELLSHDFHCHCIHPVSTASLPVATPTSFCHTHNKKANPFHYGIRSCFTMEQDARQHAHNVSAVYAKHPCNLNLDPTGHSLRSSSFRSRPARTERAVPPRPARTRSAKTNPNPSSALQHLAIQLPASDAVNHNFNRGFS